MKFEDFRIGMHFFTGSGEWVVADKGNWTIVAVPASDKHKIKSTYIDCEPTVFEPIDFGGCDLQDRFS